MGIFSKPEVIILKETSNAKVYLKQLEELLPNVSEDMKQKISREMMITQIGIMGENNILFELKNSNMDMIVLHDIYIETKHGLGAQIDFAVVTSKLIFIIECKNLFGNIEIDSKGNFIRTIEYGGKRYKEGIYSPITQNERHMAVLRECRAEDSNRIWGAALRQTFDHFYKSLVVLANPKTVVNDRYAKKEVKDTVLRADQLITVIKKLETQAKGIPSSKKEMLLIAESLLKRNKDTRKDYIQKYNEIVSGLQSETSNSNVLNHQETSSKEISIVCPKCGSNLVKRLAKRGNNSGQEFYGCTSYPKCHFTLNIQN